MSRSLRFPRFGALVLAATVCISGLSEEAAASGTRAAALYSATDYFVQAAGKPGGTLRVSADNDIGTFDLHSVSHGNSQWLGRLLFDNLVYLDDQGRPTPWLAKSWDISADGKTYTFHLRDDVTFSDGSKLDAETIRINLEHMRAPATKSPLAGPYIAPYLDGKVIDEHTFEAHLREPYAPFLDVLAQGWLAIFSGKALTENPRGFGEKPVGSGPFVLESYSFQRGMKLVRRADYHWAPDFLRHRGPAYLERIHVDVVPESLIRYSSLRSGQYDFTLSAPPQNAAAIRADRRLALDNRIRKGSPARALSFNTSKPPFDDVRLRRALAFALDREGIAYVAGLGEFQPTSAFLSENTPHYDADFHDVFRQDLARANRLLDEAGWTGRDADGFRTRNGERLSAEMLVAESYTLPPVPVAVQADARRVGIELRMAYLPNLLIAERRNNNDFQATSSGVWQTNTPDILYILYHSDEITSAKRIGQNANQLRDPQLDAELAAARQALDPVERQYHYTRVQQLLTEIVPAIPAYENNFITARTRKLQGVLYDTSHNTPIFTAAWFEEDAR